MTEKVALFCKSFASDFIHLRHLLDTFQQHNPDGIKLTLSLPLADIPRFADIFGTEIANCKVVADESYCGCDLSKYRGWHGQQICKLMSWQAVDADHFAVLDSDCYFIRDLDASILHPRQGSRFIACGSKIRTVFKGGNLDLLNYIGGSLASEDAYLPRRPINIVDNLQDYIRFKDLDPDNPGAVERSDIPFKALGGEDWYFFQPGQIFSSALLVEMGKFFQGHGVSVADAIMICPWEYNWYGEYAATHAFDDTDFRVSPFIHFQSTEDLDIARATGIDQGALATRFTFIQMAARHIEDLCL